MHPMIDYDADDTSLEALIEHCSLDDLLQFVVARDEVRRIPAPLIERDERDDALALPCSPTMPAGVLVVGTSSGVRKVA
jgi:hypothetical protein